MSSTDPQPSQRVGLIRRTLSRRWKGLLAAWLVGSLALGALAYRTIWPSYKALSLIRADPQVTDLYGIRNSESMEAFLETQVQLVASPNVLTAAAASPGVAALGRFQDSAEVFQELRKAISVSVIPKTYLIEVSMTSTSGFEAATIVNAVVDAFMDASSEWSDGMTRSQIKNLEAYSIDLKNQTDELERRWKNLAAKNDVDMAPRALADPNQVPVRLNITIEEYRQGHKDLNDTELQLAEARAWLSAAKASLERASKIDGQADAQALLDRQDKQVERMFKVDPEVISLMAEMRKAQGKLEDATRLAIDPKDPAQFSARIKLDALKRQYDLLWQDKQVTLRDQIVMADGAKPTSPEQEIKQATAAIDKLMARRVVLASHLQKLDVKNKNGAADAVEIELIRDERASLKEMQQAVVRRLEQLRFEAKGEARVRPVNRAVPPGRPITDHRLLVLGVIPFATLLGLFGLFVGLEALSGPAPTPGLARVEPPQEA